MSNKTFLGKVGTTPKGEWSASTTYERLDWVTYQGSSYIALAQNTNSTPSDSNPNWMVAAKHGEFTEEQLEEFKAAVVADSKEEMDEYTDTKKGVLDSYTTTKEGELDTYTNTKKGELDTHTTQKISDFDSNATAKTGTFNQNASDKTDAFNSNATQKTTDFNDNATAKTTAFDNNASSKTTDFNTNATSKTGDFNDNASSKTTDFNTNAQNKTDDFDSHVAEYTTRLNELEQENKRLLNAGYKISGTGSNITLNKTSENEFVESPLPGGNSTQVQLTGKNKFNPALLSQEEDYNTYNSTTKLWTTTSNSGWSKSFLYNVGGADADRNITKLIKLKPSTEYYLKIYDFVDNTGQSSGAVQLAVFDSEGHKIQEYTRANATKKFTTPNQECYLDIRRYSNAGTISFSKIQLEEGSEATDFEPYCGGIPSPNPTYKQDIHNVSGNVEVDIQNKYPNLLNGFEQGTIGGGNKQDSTTRIRTPNFIPIEKLDYIINALATNNQDLQCAVHFYNDNYEIQTSTSWEDIPYNFSVTDNSYKYCYIVVKYTNNANITPSAISTALFAGKGHEQQTLPFTLSQGQKMHAGDYLADDGIHITRGEITFDGSNDESWSSYNQSTGVVKRRFIYTISDIKVPTQSVNEFLILGNMVKMVAEYSQNDNFIVQQKNKDFIWIGFSETEEMTVSEFKTWLSTHNLILEYELAEEVIDPYTPTQQAQYNAIKKAVSYYEQTNITLTSDDADPIANVVAVADMNLVINEQNQAIVALGGVI